MSLLIAAILMACSLTVYSPGNSNTAAYREKLDALDQEYQDAVFSANAKTFLFGDRFPFYQ